MNKKSLLAGILLGIAVVVSLGIVYIDSVKHYWQFSGGFVRLVVNTNAQASITITTNTLLIGINTNNTTRGIDIVGRTPTNVPTATGTSAALTGGARILGAKGGTTTIPTTGTAGNGGQLTFQSGAGGDVFLARTNATGGNGGAVQIIAGAGGNDNSFSEVATNQLVGGAGGIVQITSGVGGSPGGSGTEATNVVGGDGGAFTFQTGVGGSPQGGLFQKGGNGGTFAIAGGNGGTGNRTNSGDGGAVTLTAGNAPNASNGGNPGKAGDIIFAGGNGGTGTGASNANGGSFYFLGGSSAAAATPGNMAVGRNSAGTARGGLQVGPLVAGTTATLTNLLTITATLDFPSIAAGTVADLNVAFAGAADGDVVTLGVPLSSVTNCTWMGFASNAVVYVRAANGQLVTAQDPNSGVFRIVLQKYR